ncbi:MAG: hypothetical protein RIC55_22970 [Pirellulaceae bacterium]
MYQLLAVSPQAEVAVEEPMPAQWSPMEDPTFGGGLWRIDEWRWQVGATTVAADEIEGRLGRLNEVQLPDGSSPRASESLQAVVEAVRKLEFTMTTQGDRRIYRRDVPGGKLCVITRIDEDAETLLALGAAREDPASGQWSLYELSSKPERIVRKDVMHLLPMPDSAESLISRVSADEQPTLEMFNLPRGPGGLTDLWRAAGWQVQRAPYAPRDQFYFLCEKEGQVVYAWSPDRGEKINRITLVRIPESNEIKEDSLSPLQTEAPR